MDGQVSGRKASIAMVEYVTRLQIKVPAFELWIVDDVLVSQRMLTKKLKGWLWNCSPRHILSVSSLPASQILTRGTASGAWYLR